jgi:hypothetical protein
MLISTREHAMMNALADCDARNVSEIVRELVRKEYVAKFETRIPVTDTKTGRTYLWERVGDEHRLFLASLDKTVTPQATLLRSGSAFRVQHCAPETPSSLVKMLAKAAGIAVV